MELMIQYHVARTSSNRELASALASAHPYWIAARELETSLIQKD